jgi:hypothetical protein
MAKLPEIISCSYEKGYFELREPAQKTRGGNMKESLAMLLKTNGGKMSEKRLLAMLMKLNELKSVSRDVDEKNGDTVGRKLGKRGGDRRKPLRYGFRRPSIQYQLTDRSSLPNSGAAA